MAQMTLLCRTATTFKANGELDEEAQRAFLQRLADVGFGFYLASAGSGEGHALSWDDIARVYKAGLDVGKGKVQVNSNFPEQHTAGNAIKYARQAVDAGIDVVNIYHPSSWHGFKPTPDELMSYFEEVLPAVGHKVALAPNPTIGYTPSAAVIADIANRHKNVVAINLAGLNDVYFTQLKDGITRGEVEIYVPFTGSLNMLAAGATGLLGAEANIIPKTFRKYIDLASAGDAKAAAPVYADLTRFRQYVMPWQSSTPRWIKMALKILKLPGGEGGLRSPYKMPDDAELKKFRDGLVKLNIDELNELL